MLVNCYTVPTLEKLKLRSYNNFRVTEFLVMRNGFLIDGANMNYFKNNSFIFL